MQRRRVQRKQKQTQQQKRADGVVPWTTLVVCLFVVSGLWIVTKRAAWDGKTTMGGGNSKSLRETLSKESEWSIAKDANDVSFRIKFKPPTRLDQPADDGAAQGKPAPRWSGLAFTEAMQKEDAEQRRVRVEAAFSILLKGQQAEKGRDHWLFYMNDGDDGDEKKQDDGDAKPTAGKVECGFSMDQPEADEQPIVDEHVQEAANRINSVASYRASADLKQLELLDADGGVVFTLKQ
eukprot:TRINITY_DN65723_c7_g2_i1.p2 TRINITY_DN65723_c7_g2~~TRINITY_DN65723_c7_g2_i1.p2  ORF type:complete len:236 (-),score=125.07 TRINITY_DN65723_c7_g2_i1:74-781(-)